MQLSPPVDTVGSKVAACDIFLKFREGSIKKIGRPLTWGEEILRFYIYRRCMNEGCENKYIIPFSFLKSY